MDLSWGQITYFGSKVLSSKTFSFDVWQNLLETRISLANAGTRLISHIAKKYWFQIGFIVKILALVGILKFDFW